MRDTHSLAIIATKPFVSSAITATKPVFLVVGGTAGIVEKKQGRSEGRQRLHPSRDQKRSRVVAAGRRGRQNGKPVLSRRRGFALKGLRPTLVVSLICADGTLEHVETAAKVASGSWEYLGSSRSQCIGQADTAPSSRKARAPAGKTPYPFPNRSK